MFWYTKKIRIRLFFALFAVLLTGQAIGVWAGELLPIRLVSMVKQDDQGEGIGFPIYVFYDHWASETYLVSSTSRITVYDSKFFPVASFGKGRGVVNPSGLTVDRHGRIYLCQRGNNVGSPAQLVIYNQAFFPVKHIVFADIPQLTDFSATRVAVSETGEIYLCGVRGAELVDGVVVLSPGGEFLRILASPEMDAWRENSKNPEPSAANDNEVSAPELDATPRQNDAGVESVAMEIPAGLKPKTSGQRVDSESEKGEMGSAYISDVKIDRQGRIYLLSRETSKTYVFNANEEYLFNFGEKGGADRKLSNPVSLAIDLDRRAIYVCDYMRHSILCYDYDTGKYVFEFGGRGLGPLWFNFPNGVEVDQRGRVMVSDLFNRRVQVIDTNLEKRRPIAIISTKGPSPDSDAESMARNNPPQVAQIAKPGDILTPGAVLPPILPAGITGFVGVHQDRIAMPKISTTAVRELLPRLKKKSVAGPELELNLAQVAPLPTPKKFMQPATVRVTSQIAPGTPSRDVEKDRNPIIRAVKWLPAAVGVYGPVAYTISLGSRLLSTNR